MGGTSVFRVRADDPNRNVIVETVSREGARTVMVQRFIPEIAEGDKRVLLIAGEPVPYRARAHSQGRARRAATSPPAAAASRARSPRATARSPPRWARSCGPRDCWSSAST